MVKRKGVRSEKISTKVIFKDWDLIKRVGALKGMGALTPRLCQFFYLFYHTTSKIYYQFLSYYWWNLKSLGLFNWYAIVAGWRFLFSFNYQHLPVFVEPFSNFGEFFSLVSISWKLLFLTSVWCLVLVMDFQFYLVTLMRQCHYTLDHPQATTLESVHPWISNI